MKKIQNARDDAFKLLNSVLSGGTISNEGEELCVTQLLWSGGALQDKSYKDVLDEWGAISKKQNQARVQLMDQLKTNSWITPLKRDEESKSSDSSEELSFKDYLIAQTIQSVEDHFADWMVKNLHKEMGLSQKFKFSSTAQKYLVKIMQSEISRSDIAHFCTNLDFLFGVNWKKSENQLKKLFTTLQAFLVLVRQFQVSNKKCSDLLEMMLHCPSFDFESMIASIDQIGDPDSFNCAWDDFEVIMGGLKAQNYLEDSFSFFIFIYLLETGSPIYAPFFQNMSKYRAMTLTPKIVYDFLIRNQNLNKQEADLLSAATGSVLQLLNVNEFDYPQPESLFLDPPINVRKSEEILKNAEDSAGVFIKFIDESMLWTAGTQRLLNHYIYHPHPEVFELIRDLPELQPREECIAEVLSLSSSFSLDLNMKSEREFAMSFLKAIRQKYDFKPQELFSLYVGFIQYISDKRVNEIHQMAKFIHRLEEFCPSLNSTIAYFLFRFLPKNSTHLIDRLDEIKSSYVDMKRDGFILDQKAYELIVKNIEDLSLYLQVTSTESDKFSVSIKNALFRSFFPPIQCLTDYFRISGLSCVDGIRWAADFLQTHEGQFRSVFSKSNMGIFIHWQLVAGYPVLFLSFADQKSAQSAFILMNCRVDEDLSWKKEIENEEKGEEEKKGESPLTFRRQFFSYLFNVSQHVFNEEVDSDTLLDVSDQMEEGREKWMMYYPGLKETLDMYELDDQYADRVWEFMKKVKLAYRNLYLAKTLNLSPESDPKSALQSAAQGNIYMSKTFPRGILIPEYLQSIESNHEFYIPDLDEKGVEIARILFSKKTGIKKLEINQYLIQLCLTSDGLNSDKHTLQYQVQEPDELIGCPLEKIPKDKYYEHIALPIDQVEGTYVTLSIAFDNSTEQKSIGLPMHYPADVLADPAKFLERFDRHYLFMKSLCYYHFAVNVALLNAKKREMSM